MGAVMTFKELCDEFSSKRPQGPATGREYWFTVEFTSMFQSVNDLLRKHLKENEIQYLNTVNGDVWFLYGGEWRKCDYEPKGNTVRFYILSY